jgi:ferredoxin
MVRGAGGQHDEPDELTVGLDGAHPRHQRHAGGRPWEHRHRERVGHRSDEPLLVRVGPQREHGAHGVGPDLHQPHVRRALAGARRPRPMLLVREAVAGVVGPAVGAGPHRGRGEALQLEAERLDEPGRRDVAGVERGLHAMHVAGGEQPVDDRADGLGRQPAALRGSGQRVPDRRDAPVRAEAERDVAHERAGVLDCDLHPVAAHRPGPLGHRRGEAVRRIERVRRVPALVPSHVGIGPVGRERRCVGGIERPQPQARRGEREERIHDEKLGDRPSRTGRTIERMKVSIEAEKCQGHNRCYALAPELFDVDDYGQAVVIGDGDVAAGLEDKARLAVANCPEYAISIQE